MNAASSSIPRVGDEFLLRAYQGVPPMPMVRVTAVEAGTVFYDFCFYLPSASSCKLSVFVEVYDPTAETKAAIERGLTLDDYRTFVRDQEELTREEARQATHDEFTAREREETQVWHAGEL